MVKIIDLGLSRLRPTSTSQPTGSTTIINPSYRFIAPELIKAKEQRDGVYMSVTKETDVYAFSMTALQVSLDFEFLGLPLFPSCVKKYFIRYWTVVVTSLCRSITASRSGMSHWLL